MNTVTEQSTNLSKPFAARFNHQGKSVRRPFKDKTLIKAYNPAGVLDVCYLEAVDLGGSLIVWVPEGEGWEIQTGWRL